MNSKVNKLLTDVLNYSNLLEMGLTIEDLNTKYNNLLLSYGEEKAIEAIKNTLKQFKTKANEQDKIFWNGVKYEIFKRGGSVPCDIRILKAMIKNNEIDITGLTHITEIKRRLNIA
jgi:hypothetical protein